MSYVSAIHPGAAPALRALEQRLRGFYANPAYHESWVRHANACWQSGAHDAQLALAARIAPGAKLLEVGCGDAAAAAELRRRVPGLRYHGVDIILPVHRDHSLQLARAAGGELPFPAQTFDVVVSMFTIEHTPFPHHFLDESWRVLRTGGELCVIAPDFLHNAMSSERIGRGYGTGREKLRAGRLLDAALTFYDSRVRLPRARRQRARELGRGGYSFTVLTNPRCLVLPGFVTDCDAVYPAAPEEISNYMRAKYGATCELFHRDAHTFGLALSAK